MTGSPRTPNHAESLFWDLIDELREHDERVEEGTIMGGRCARVSGEFLGLVDYKGSGMVVKLPRNRVDELITQGIGQPFAPAGKVFREWVVATVLRPRKPSRVDVPADGQIVKTSIWQVMAGARESRLSAVRSVHSRTSARAT